VDGIQATTHTNKGMYFCGKHAEFDCSSDNYLSELVMQAKTKCGNIFRTFFNYSYAELICTINAFLSFSQV